MALWLCPDANQRGFMAVAGAHCRCYTGRTQWECSRAGLLRTLEFSLFPLSRGFVLFPVPSPCPFHWCLHPHPLTLHLSTSCFFMLCWHPLTAAAALLFLPATLLLPVPSFLRSGGLTPISLLNTFLCFLKCWSHFAFFLFLFDWSRNTQELRPCEKCDNAERGQIRPKQKMRTSKMILIKTQTR